MRNVPTVLALLLALGACANPDAGGGARFACAEHPGTAIPIETGGGRPLVPMQIDGTPVFLHLDTGAAGSSVTPQVADRLGLARDPRRRVNLSGTGGVAVGGVATTRSLAIGPLTLSPQPLTVVALPGADASTPPASGLLGADILSRFEVELDMPARRLTLRPATGCTPGPPPWIDRRALAMPVRPMGRLFLVDLAVNEQPMRALLDTGASSSVMTEVAARRLGTTDEALAAAPSGERRGVDGNVRRSARLRFPSVRIGAERMRDASISAAPMQLSSGIEMLLGLDYARSRRLYISYGAGKVWVAAPQVAAP